MSNAWWTGSALIAFCLTALGCSNPGRFGSNEGVSPIQLPPRSGAARDDAPPVTRSQKPEGDPLPAPEAPPLPQAPPADLLTGQPAARIGATVNKQPILVEEVLAAAQPALMAARDLPEPDRSQRRAEAYNQALTALVEREVVLQDAFARLEKVGGKKNVDKLKEDASEQFEKTVLRQWMKAGNFKSQDEFRDYMQQQGVSFEMQRRLWERNFMYMEYLRSRVHSQIDGIAPKQILDYYEKHPEEFHRLDAVKWQDLFVASDKYATPGDAHRFAEQLAERARGGEDFAKLAEQYDNGDSAFRHGEGIGAKRGEIRPPEVEITLFQLKEGETAVIELPKGFHVVRIVQRDYDGLSPFDEKAQKQIKEKLTNEIAQVEMKQIVSKLKHAAVIVYSKGDN
jgi:peptidyl-prolyl cis-trans isomerase SurA